MKNSKINDIETTIFESTLLIRFDRASKKNALTIEMYKRLNTLLDEASNDDAIKVVVFSSTSDTFTAGNDLKDFQQNPPTDQSAPVYQFVNKLATFKKPMISAVDGLAVGIGLTMLLHCDFVYVTNKTKLIAPFVNLGLVPEAGSTKLLTELIGYKKAAQVFILGDHIGPQMACDYGIANAICDSDNVQSKALEIASLLGKKAPNALRLTRQLMRADSSIMDVITEE